MAELIARQGAERGAMGVGSRPDVMAMCPMATMCQRMMEKPPSRFFALLASAVLIGVGLLVLVEPRIVAWLAGFALVTFGMMLFIAANFLQKLSGRQRYNGSAKAPG